MSLDEKIVPFQSVGASLFYSGGPDEFIIPVLPTTSMGVFVLGVDQVFGEISPLPAPPRETGRGARENGDFSQRFAVKSPQLS